MPNNRAETPFGGRQSKKSNLRLSRTTLLAAYRLEGFVENTPNILTVREVATILRCSKTHALNMIEGKVRGLPKMTHLRLGRRKVVRKDWLDQWIENNRHQ